MDLRIAMVAERAPDERGGLAVSVDRISRLAAAQGDEVHLVHLSKQAPPGAMVARPEAKVVRYHVGRLPREDDTLMALTDHVARLVEAERLELVHGFYALHAGYAATLAAAWAGVPSIVSLRGNDLDRGLYRADQLPLLTHTVKRATRVTGVSRELCHKASRAFGRSVDYVPNSVDAEAFRPETPDNSLRASLGLGEGPVIGFVGELREKKGMRFLLPAFAELNRRRPASLLLIGGVRADAREAFTRFGESAPEASERIRVVDYDRSPKRLCRWLALCDLLVFPSLYDGMPNAVLEAMAAARPILATDVGGHRDLVEHGTSGALLPLSELDRLPDALEELFDLGQAERERLGKNARARVVARHRPEAEFAAYAALYREALGARDESSA
jgi:glycosyltransferase involved in cell wall biosynthesis